MEGRERERELHGDEAEGADGASLLRLGHDASLRRDVRFLGPLLLVLFLASSSSPAVEIRGILEILRFLSTFCSTYDLFNADCAEFSDLFTLGFQDIFGGNSFDALTRLEAFSCWNLCYLNWVFGQRK